MILQLQRLHHNKDTIGILSIDYRWQCFTLEDVPRDVKIPGETRIPAGEYPITLRDFGGKNDHYKSKFPGMHEGMLWLRDVPGFEDILIHIGNDAKDTEGCILVGDSCQQNITGAGFIGASTAAYKRVYPQIAKVLLACGPVSIQISDELGI